MTMIGDAIRAGALEEILGLINKKIKENKNKPEVLDVLNEIKDELESDLEDAKSGW